MRRLLIVAAALLAACNAPVAQTPPAPPSTAPGPVPAETTATAQTTASPPSGLPADYCASSLCGCWAPRALHFRVRLQDAQGAPAAGVNAICHRETQPAAQSAADGSLAIDADTLFSPGCGFRRCGNITLTDPQHRFADTQVSSRAILPNNTITLQPATP